jgi:hypothetical protein
MKNIVAGFLIVVVLAQYGILVYKGFTDGWPECGRKLKNDRRVSASPPDLSVGRMSKE